jgi:hypothetical protein
MQPLGQAIEVLEAWLLVDIRRRGRHGLFGLAIAAAFRAPVDPPGAASAAVGLAQVSVPLIMRSVSRACGPCREPPASSAHQTRGSTGAADHINRSEVRVWREPGSSGRPMTSASSLR